MRKINSPGFVNLLTFAGVLVLLLIMLWPMVFNGMRPGGADVSIQFSQIFLAGILFYYSRKIDGIQFKVKRILSTYIIGGVIYLIAIHVPVNWGIGNLITKLVIFISFPFFFIGLSYMSRLSWSELKNSDIELRAIRKH